MPSTAILYDKEISVTFYRTTHQMPTIFRTYRTDVYSDVTLENGKRKLTSADEQNTGSHTEFFEGEYIYDTEEYYKLDELIQHPDSPQLTSTFKRYKGRGRVYNVLTEEQMRQGLRPDGSPYKTGDRVRIMETGQLWTVRVIGGSPESNLTSEVVTVPAASLTLDCNKYGIKPNIVFAIKLLPNQNCYQAVLKICNFNLNMPELRSWETMVITAGYRTGKVVHYTCPIFSTYIESANPDGVTVFEGLTIGRAEDILTRQSLQISFLNTQIRLEDFIRQIADGISEGLNVTITLPQEWLDKIITIDKERVCYAENGMAVLSWLQRTVTSFIKTISNGESSGLVYMNEDGLHVLCINGPNAIPVNKESIINLDMVTGAVFNGTALTVTAPWNPALKPGDLFYMPPNFINGSRLFNEIPPSMYRNDQNLYRSITIDVEFATVQATNKMTVLAIPAQYTERTDIHDSTDMTDDTFSRTLGKSLQEDVREIKVGTQTKKASDINNIHDAPETNVKLIDNNRNIYDIWGQWKEVKHSIAWGSCLTQIANYYLTKWENGPLLANDKGTGKVRDYFYSYDELRKMNLPMAAKHVQNSGCLGYLIWFPLIAVGTFWRKYVADSNGEPNSYTAINLTNLDYVQENKYVVIPEFTGTWKEQEDKLKQMKDVWKYAYLEYRLKYPGYANCWRAMYYYLGGEENLD